MDAEGLGRKLLLIPSGDPHRSPEKQTAGTVAASHQMLSPCKHFRHLSMLALQRGAAWAEERLSGALWQSVPQNGRVHLHIIEATFVLFHAIVPRFPRFYLKIVAIYFPSAPRYGPRNTYMS